MTLRYRTPDGQWVEAPVELWAAAILDALPTEVRARAIELVTRTPVVRQDADGKRHHVLRAEPGRFGLKMG